MPALAGAAYRFFGPRAGTFTDTSNQGQDVDGRPIGSPAFGAGRERKREREREKVGGAN